MKVGRFVQWLILAVIWIGVGVVALISAIAAFLTSWSLSPLWILALFAIGIILTGIAMSNEAFTEFNTQIEDQLSELSDAEMLEVMRGLDEVYDNLGIEIELPIKGKKRKRENIDKAIRNLSDTELLHLKERLREGSIDEEKLMAWLDAQHAMMDEN